MGLLELVRSEMGMRVGDVLLYSLWQGAAVCALAGIGLWMLRRKSAAVRYLCAIAALAMMIVLPVMTFGVLMGFDRFTAHSQAGRLTRTAAAFGEPARGARGQVA